MPTRPLLVRDAHRTVHALSSRRKVAYAASNDQGARVTKAKPSTLLFICLATLSSAAWASKSCEELKGEIDTKLQAKGVKDYSLTVVDKDSVKDGKVVGSCEGGAKKIVYARGDRQPS